MKPWDHAAMVSALAALNEALVSAIGTHEAVHEGRLVPSSQIRLVVKTSWSAEDGVHTSVRATGPTGPVMARSAHETLALRGCLVSLEAAAMSMAEALDGLVRSFSAKISHLGTPLGEDMVLLSWKIGKSTHYKTTLDSMVAALRTHVDAACHAGRCPGPAEGWRDYLLYQDDQDTAAFLRMLEAPSHAEAMVLARSAIQRLSRNRPAGGRIRLHVLEDLGTI